MNTTKILVAGLIGAAVALLLGFLCFGMLFADFFESHTGSATGIMRGDENMLWGPMIIGHVAWGLLFAIIYGRWASISTFATGAKAGAVIGLLVGLTVDMIYYGSTNIYDLTGAMTDVVLMTVLSAIVGGCVGWYLGRGSAKS
jgi:hypothetical protein